MISILDIDLDAFQFGFAERRPANKPYRLDTDKRYAHITTWPHAKVEDFLKTSCRLSITNPIPGIYVDYHHEVFGQVREMIRDDLLKPPFIWIHVDAHADLGCGDASCQYVFRELVQRTPDNRTNPKLRFVEGADDIEGLDEGNYILFLIACRWLHSLTYVHSDARFDDIPYPIFLNEVPTVGKIELSKFSLSDLKAYSRIQDMIREGIKPECVEPPVTFKRYPILDYVSEHDFSLAFVCRSPNYTRSTTDQLLPILSRFIIPTNVNSNSKRSF